MKLNDIEFAALARKANELLDHANKLILGARQAHVKSEQHEKKKAA